MSATNDELDKIRIAGMKFTLSGFAVCVMGMGILAPAVTYAVQLRDPRLLNCLLPSVYRYFSVLCFSGF
jgi:hypothetical protein